MGVPTLEQAFAAVAQAQPDTTSDDGALAPASGTGAEPSTPDPISELATRLGGLSPDERKRLITSAAADVLDAEANARASKTLSRKQQEIEHLRQQQDVAERMQAVLSDDYDAIETTAKAQAQQWAREQALADPELLGAAQQQWLAYQAQAARQHDFWKDVPAEVWAQADQIPDVAEAFATMARAVVQKGYVPKSEVQRQVNDAVARERTRLMGGISSPDTSRSEAASSPDDVTAQLRGVNAAIRARGGNPTKEQMALLESLTSRLQGTG